MKLYKIIYITVFFIIISIPFIAMPFYRQHENTENKVLLERPEPVSNGRYNINYLSELVDWYEEHFAFRQELVTANALWKGRVFGESSEDLAIVGKDGWLYLKVSLDDYQGTNLASDRKLFNTARTIYLMQEYVESLGKTFVFTCAPNKNTLYPEHMPYYYKVVSDKKNLDAITPILYEQGVNYVDLKKAFADEDEVLYHKGDSHWNNKGAAMVQNLLLDEAGVAHDNFLEMDYEIRDDFEGDIDKILYPLARHREDEYDYSSHMTYKYSGTDDVTAVNVETYNDDKTGGLFCYRDSFGNSLLPFLANEFEYATFSKSATYRIDSMAWADYDVCIIEVVERNLMNMVKFAPVMPAPLRTIDGTVIDYKSDNSTIYWTNFDNYYKISGYVDSGYLSYDSSVYIRLSNEDYSFTLEAFPVDEGNIDGNSSGKTSDYGFTAYIGSSSLPKGSYSAEIITGMDDTYYSYMSDETIDFE